MRQLDHFFGWLFSHGGVAASFLLQPGILYHGVNNRCFSYFQEQCFYSWAPLLVCLPVSAKGSQPEPGYVPWKHFETNMLGSEMEVIFIPLPESAFTCLHGKLTTQYIFTKVYNAECVLCIF